MNRLVTVTTISDIIEKRAQNFYYFLKAKIKKKSDIYLVQKLQMNWLVTAATISDIIENLLKTLFYFFKTKVKITISV